MKSKKTEIDFGTLYVNRGNADASLLSHEFEKAIQVNGDTIIEDGAYKHRQSASDRPIRVKVTVEIVEA